MNIFITEEEWKDMSDFIPEEYQKMYNRVKRVTDVLIKRGRIRSCTYTQRSDLDKKQNNIVSVYI
jgi:hypothetical protein